MPTTWPRLAKAHGWLSIERTDLLEAALDNGWTLDLMCPHPNCDRTADVSWEWDNALCPSQVVVEMQPCGHRYWPQWRVPKPKPSRFLNSPVSRHSPRWWQRTARARGEHPLRTPAPWTT
ncbi:hypothetical protein AB0G67_40330 [Streptomyces sp. NPDC021056]|uniref:hypothetical protein n=1 Tax=Streptomyces sp. NPDC021056 TaxID=3155012 RepID=UPI0034113AE3